MNIGKRLIVFALLVLCIGLVATQASAGPPYVPIFTQDNNLSIVNAAGAATGGANDIVFTWDGTLKTSVAASGQVSNGYINAKTNNGGFVQTCKTGTGGTAWKGHDVALYGPGSYTVYASCAPGAPACAGGTNPISFTVGAGEIGVHMLVDWGTVVSNKNIDVVNVLTPGVFGPSAMWTGACGSNPASKVWDLMSKDPGIGRNGYPMVDGPFIGTAWNFNLKGAPINRVVDTENNNFTMLDLDGMFIGGTNDVRFTWDGTKKTAVECPQVSNATISSPCPFFGTGKTWLAHDVAVYGPGTYTIYDACPPGCPNDPNCTNASGMNNPVTFTVAEGEIAGHMLFFWGGNDDIDVVNIWQPSKVFGPWPSFCVFIPELEHMWTGACGSNPASRVWDLMSYDWGSTDGAGSVAQTPDCINGAPMTDGPFGGSSANFNVMGMCAGCGCICLPPASYDDGNPCTIDSCDTTASGVEFCPGLHTRLSGPPGSCDDGNPCTIDDRCDLGFCQGTPVICNDNNLCTTDSCDPATGNCRFTPKNCNDNNPCTIDYCDAATGYCINTPVPDGNCCDPFETCLCSSICMGGHCALLFVPINKCDDSNPCTEDICNKATGTCSYTCNTNTCSDGNACTVGDACSNCTCLPGTPKVCNDNNVCTTDSCDRTSGCMYTPKNCDDGNVCTIDSCNQSNGKCVHTPIKKCKR